MSVKIFIDKVLEATAEPNNSLKICSKIFTASCCVLISKDALPDFLREFVREVKKNDGSIQDFDESNFAMTRRGMRKPKVKWSVKVSKSQTRKQIKALPLAKNINIAGVTLIKETTVNVLSQFLNCICSRYFWRVGFKNSSGRTWRGWNFPVFGWTPVTEDGLGLLTG